MAVHERFGCARFIEEFPLAPMQAKYDEYIREAQRRKRAGESRIPYSEWPMKPGDITLPQAIRLTTTEQMRKAAAVLEDADEDPLGRLMLAPCDALIWADGEPKHPAATKFGGVPHRPRSLPWPRNEDGQPCQFYCQICFTDSLDILVDADGSPLALPGDVLLLFRGDSGSFWGEFEPPAYFEWHPLELSDPAGPADVPPLSEGFEALRSVHAQLHRTIAAVAYEEASIGGVPSFLQDPPDEDPGTLIASLHGIDAMGLRYPLANLPEVAEDMRFWPGWPRFGGGHLLLFFSRDQAGAPLLIAKDEID